MGMAKVSNGAYTSGCSLDQGQQVLEEHPTK